MIKYNFGQIDTLRADIAASTAQMNAALADLRSYLGPLVADWTGGAAEAYQVQQRRWDDAAQGLNQVLDAIGRAVGAGNDQMAAAERAAMNQWAG
ncbi:WXG100 family type VII secretion target [Hoyosella sp. YIM 151337]|uniref:WXG100 family type VII secretion target n=1 Tax=Hoyosella sp. YIM 151337 TaxID=2992742 RepID=UPI002236934A|nr:WXG100 family type VII secretion target [Hoyosella sp. YIM 151337]MCW4352525.1 WXG100 family type VII secretion target [Hoyosella sp. YIM 151337]